MARASGRPLHGWLVVDKPAGLTSAAVVGRLKRAFDAAKVGHGGTLDPLATGVLPLAFGEATKLLWTVLDGRKRYRFTVRWGEARSTADAAGEVTASSAVRPAPAAIEAVLPHFIGVIEQVPPAFSAVRVDGRRAYDLARAGESPVLPPRQVQIDSLVMLATDADSASFELACGKGTYVRSLAVDLARALGTVGHVAALRRLQCGRFTEAQAIPLESLLGDPHNRASPERLLPILTALDDIPALAVTGSEAEFIRTGQAITPLGTFRAGEFGSLRDGDVVCVTTGEQPVALARMDSGRLRPVRVFNL